MELYAEQVVKAREILHSDLKEAREALHKRAGGGHEPAGTGSGHRDERIMEIPQLFHQFRTIGRRR